MNKSVKEGWYNVPPINTERYGERAGLEGPFQTKAGKVVYYDPKEGAYYDPDTDIYLSYEEWAALNESVKYGVVYTTADDKTVPMLHKNYDTRDAAVKVAEAAVRTGSYKAYNVVEANVPGSPYNGMDRETRQIYQNLLYHGGGGSWTAQKAAQAARNRGTLAASTDYSVYTDKDVKADGAAASAKYKEVVALFNKEKAAGTTGRKLMALKKAGSELSSFPRYVENQAYDMNGYGAIFTGKKPWEELSDMAKAGVVRKQAQIKKKKAAINDLLAKLGLEPVSFVGSETTVEGKLPPHLAKFVDDKGDFTPEVKARLGKDGEERLLGKKKPVEEAGLGTGLKAFSRSGERLSRDPRLIKMTLMLQGPEFIQQIATTDRGQSNPAFDRLMKMLGIPSAGDLQQRIAKKLVQSGEYKKAKKAEFSMMAYNPDDIRAMYADLIKEINKGKEMNESYQDEMKKINGAIDTARAAIPGLKAGGDLEKVGALQAAVEGLIYAVNKGGNTNFHIARIHELLSGGMNESKSPAYNKDAVDKEIKKDKRIGGKEAKAIHGLLKGRTAEKKTVKEDIALDAAGMEQDHEVQMARGQLYHAARDAIRLHQMLKTVSEDNGIESWVQAKITTAAEYLKTVADYMEYELINDGIDSTVGISSDQVQMPIGETTAGGIAGVVMPLGSVQKRKRPVKK